MLLVDKRLTLSTWYSSRIIYTRSIDSISIYHHTSNHAIVVSLIPHPNHGKV